MKTNRPPNLNSAGLPRASLVLLAYLPDRHPTPGFVDRLQLRLGREAHAPLLAVVDRHAIAPSWRSSCSFLEGQLEALDFLPNLSQFHLGSTMLLYDENHHRR